MTYETRSGDAVADRDLVLDLWQGALEGVLSRRQKYLLHYQQCPWGAPDIELLENDGQAVGVAAVQPRSMHRYGEEVKTGLLIDFAVSPAHRSVGPALKLQKSLLARCEERYDLIYGMPNANARALSRRAGMQEVGSIVRMVRVLRYSRYIRSYLPEMFASLAGRVLDASISLAGSLRRVYHGQMVATWSDMPVAEIDALWKEQTDAHGDCLIAPRDNLRLGWRLAPTATRRTRYLLLRDVRSGRLAGWFACQRFAETLKVMDYWAPGAARGTNRALLDALAAAAAAVGCASVTIELSAPEVVLQSWMAAGFVARESRPVFAKWSRALEGSTPRPAMFLTSADEDE